MALERAQREPAAEGEKGGQQPGSAGHHPEPALAGINSSDGRCIDLLDLHGPMTAGELAAAAALSPGAVTTVLNRLERRGLVLRRRDEEDRRRVIAELTDEARRLAYQVYGPISAYAAPYLDQLSDDELGVILRFLESAIEVNERRAREIADGERGSA